MRRSLQAIKVTIQTKDTAIVNAEALPDGVTALHDTVKHGNLCLVSVYEFSADMDHDVGISGVEGL